MVSFVRAQGGGCAQKRASSFRAEGGDVGACPDLAGVGLYDLRLTCADAGRDLNAAGIV